MQNSLILTALMLVSLNQHLYADELEISITGMSDEPTLKQGAIVGCDDSKATEKELSCSKAPEEMILGKLPSSFQLESKDFNKDEDIEQIKEELHSIMDQLMAMREQQEKSKKIQNELRSIIQKLISKERVSARKRRVVVQKRIQNLKRKHQHKKYTKTLISKPIKLIEEGIDYKIIEVQEGESLSTYAQAYYHDNTQYYRIYKANRDKIGSNLQVVIGDHLKIPLD